LHRRVVLILNSHWLHRRLNMPEILNIRITVQDQGDIDAFASRLSDLKGLL